MYNNKKIYPNNWFESNGHSTNLIPKKALHYILTFLFNQMLIDKKNTIEIKHAKHKNFMFNYYKAFKIYKRLFAKGKICMSR